MLLKQYYKPKKNMLNREIINGYQTEELDSFEMTTINGGDDIIATIVEFGIYFIVGAAVRHLWNRIFH